MALSLFPSLNSPFPQFPAYFSGQVGGTRQNRLGGVHRYASAHFLDILELAENCTFLDQKLIGALYETVDGHYLVENIEMAARDVKGGDFK